MRGGKRFHDPSWPVLSPLALVLAGQAPVVWGVAGLAFATVVVPQALMLALLPALAAVLAPLVLACPSWSGSGWLWLCQPSWSLRPWSWLGSLWLTWPW